MAAARARETGWVAVYAVPRVRFHIRPGAQFPDFRLEGYRRVHGGCAGGCVALAQRLLRRHWEHECMYEYSYERVQGAVLTQQQAHRR